MPTVDNSNGGITPTGVATLAGYTSSINNGSTYTFSAGLARNGNGLFNSFNIDATPVPFDFDPSLGLLGVGSLWLGRKYLKKIASRTKDKQILHLIASSLPVYVSKCRSPPAPLQSYRVHTSPTVYVLIDLSPPKSPNSGGL